MKIWLNCFACFRNVPGQASPNSIQATKTDSCITCGWKFQIPLRLSQHLYCQCWNQRAWTCAIGVLVFSIPSRPVFHYSSVGKHPSWNGRQTIVVYFMAYICESIAPDTRHVHVHQCMWSVSVQWTLHYRMVFELNFWHGSWTESPWNHFSPLDWNWREWRKLHSYQYSWALVQDSIYKVTVWGKV